LGLSVPTGQENPASAGAKLAENRKPLLDPPKPAVRVPGKNSGPRLPFWGILRTEEKGGQRRAKTGGGGGGGGGKRLFPPGKNFFFPPTLPAIPFRWYPAYFQRAKKDPGRRSGTIDSPVGLTQWAPRRVGGSLVPIWQNKRPPPGGRFQGAQPAPLAARGGGGGFGTPPPPPATPPPPPPPPPPPKGETGGAPFGLLEGNAGWKNSRPERPPAGKARGEKHGAGNRWVGNRGTIFIRPNA